ncbi:MAG: hypothetical protein AAB882_00140 [Patescibacteria group bacterium]
MRKIFATVGTVLAFGIAGVAFAQTALPEGVTDEQMNSALKDLSAVYGASVVRLDQAKAICNEEQYVVDCAEIGKKYDLFSDARTKQVDALLTEFKGEIVEKMKQCENVACLVDVATSIASRLNSGNPSVARAVELTPQKVNEKRAIVDTAKSLGVDIEACRTMDPDTASVELLRGCARLAKHENVQKYVPQATKDRADGADAAIALKESLANGQTSCGDNTLEGCGNFCLAPSPEARAKGTSAIPEVCRQIASKFFGNDGLKELEDAYSTVQNTFNTLADRAQNIVFTTADGRTLSDPASIGRYMEEVGSRGDVKAVSRGMDFLIAKGFITPEDRDFAVSMVKKVKERGPVNFGECRTDPSRCADLVSEEDREQFTAMGEVEKIMRGEMEKRGITNPSRCSSDPSAGQSCMEAARAALPQIERLAETSPQARAVASDIRQKIRFGEAGLEARSRVEERFMAEGNFSMGDQRFRSIAELEVFCETNSQQCLNETARDGIFSKEVATERYEHSIDVGYNAIPPENMQRTQFTAGNFNKEEALQQFKQWLDNPTGPPPMPPNIDSRQYPTPYPQYPRTPIDRVGCQYAASIPIPCKDGEYRQESINEFGCPSFGSCIPLTTKTEPPRPDGRNICPALPTVESCPAGEEKRISFSSPECGTYYSCRAISKPPVDDQNRTTSGCERYGSGWRSMDSSGNCFNPSMTEYRTTNGALYTCATFPAYGCGPIGIPPSPTIGGQRDQVWNSSGLRSSIRSDASADRIESLKNACANVSSRANVWLPDSGTQSSVDFGMPDPAKCAKAAACSSAQYFDGTACSTTASTLYAQSCGYNEYWNGSNCVQSSTATSTTGWNSESARQGCASAGGIWDSTTNYCRMPNETQNTAVTGSCSSELIGLLGNGCHSMGNGWFNSEMTKYVSSGQTVRSCTTEYLSGCTTGTNTQTQTSCPTDQYWNGSICVTSTTQTPCPSGQYVNGACAYPSSITTTCSSGQYWNGSACVTSTTQTSCGTGQYWNGSACVSSTQTTTGTYDTASAQQGCTSAGGTWDSAANYCRMPSSSTTASPSSGSYDSSSAQQGCANAGGTWNGSYCNMPSSSGTYTAPSSDSYTPPPSSSYTPPPSESYTPPPSESAPISYLFCPDDHDWNGAYCTLSPRSPFERYTASVWFALRSLLGL